MIKKIIYLSNCPLDCPDDSVLTIFHALRHYRYLIELTFVNLLLRLFVKIHRNFQLEEYFINFYGEVKFILLHRKVDIIITLPWTSQTKVNL